MTTVERLEQILNDKDAEIAKLKEERDEAVFAAKSRWTMHEVSSAEEDKSGLPIPRLEMSFRSLSVDHYEVEMVTFLVFRHYQGDLVVRVPLRRTTSSGGSSRWNVSGSFDLPMHDGPALFHDIEHLRLPAYAVDSDGHVENLSGRRTAYTHFANEGRRHRFAGESE